MSQSVVENGPREVLTDIEAYTKYLLERQSLKFRGDAGDVAQAMLFLVSRRARFITGQNLSVDGGWWMQ